MRIPNDAKIWKPSPVALSIIPRRVETPWACLSLAAGYQHVGVIGVKKKDYVRYSTFDEADQHITLNRPQLSQSVYSGSFDAFASPLSQSVIDEYQKKWRVNAAVRMKLHPELECNSKYEFISCRRFVNKHQEVIRWRRHRSMLAHEVELIRKKSLIPVIVPVREDDFKYHSILNKSDCSRCQEIEFLCYACKTSCHEHPDPKFKQLACRQGLKALLRISPSSTYFSNNYSIAAISKTVSAGTGGIDQTELPVYPSERYLRHIIPSSEFAVRISRIALAIAAPEKFPSWNQNADVWSENNSVPSSSKSESINESIVRPEIEHELQTEHIHVHEHETEPEVEQEHLVQTPCFHQNNPYRRRKYFRAYQKPSSLESVFAPGAIIGASVAASLVTPAPSPPLGRQQWHSVSVCPRRLLPRLSEYRQEEQLDDDLSFASSIDTVDASVDARKPKVTDTTITASDVVVTCDCCLRNDCRVLPSIRELTYSRKGRSFIHWAVIKLQRWSRLCISKRLIQFKNIQEKRKIFLFAQKFYNELIVAPIIQHISNFDERRREANECLIMATEDSEMKKFVKKLNAQMAVINMNKMMNSIQKCFGQLSIQVHRPQCIPRHRFHSYNVAAPLLEAVSTSNMPKRTGLKVALSKYLKSNQINVRAVSTGPHMEYVEPPAYTVEEINTETLLYPSYAFSWLSAKYMQSYLPFNYRSSSSSFFHSTKYFPTDCGASSTLDRGNLWYKKDADLYNFMERFTSDMPYELLNRFYLHLRIKREKVLEHLEWKRRDQFMNRKAYRQNILNQATMIMKVSQSLTRNNSTDSLDDKEKDASRDAAMHTTSILMSDVLKAERLQRQKSLIRHKQIVKQVIWEEWTHAGLNYQQAFVEKSILLKNAKEKKIESPSYTVATSQFVGKPELPCYNDTGRRKRSYTIGDPMQLSHRLQQVMFNFKQHQQHSVIRSDDADRNSLTESKMIAEKSSYTKIKPESKVKNPAIKKATLVTRRRSTGKEPKQESNQIIADDMKRVNFISRPRSRSMPELRVLHNQRQNVSITMKAMFCDKIHDARIPKQLPDEIQDVVDLMKYNAENSQKNSSSLISSIAFYEMRVLLCEELYDQKYMGLWRNVPKLKFRKRIVKGVLTFTCNYFQYWRDTPQLSDPLYGKGRSRVPKRRHSISDPERANRVTEVKKKIYNAQNGLLNSANSRFGMRRRSRSFDR